MNLKRAKKLAAIWSLDTNNNISEAVVIKMGKNFIIASDFNDESKIVARFMDGIEVK